MNITLNTNNFNSQYYNNNIKNNKNNQTKYAGISYNSQPTFKGIEVPTHSKVLAPFHRAIDSLTSWIARNYTEKLYTSKIAAYLAKKTDKLGSVVDHMQVMGSIIISGMYMTQTLRNKQLDDDRKKTLAINQGLTFVLSTLGSYIIDEKLENRWEKITTKYAAKELGDEKLAEKIAKYNQELAAQFEAKQLNGINTKKTKFKPASVLKYVEENIPNTSLEKRLRGMGVLKKLVVFGTVYRFIAPVAVTPLATWVSNKFIHKKDKTVNTKASVNQPSKASDNNKSEATKQA